MKMEFRKLEPELYYILRDGMALRKKHIIEIYGSPLLDLAYPKLVKKVYQGMYQGTDELKESIPNNEFYDLDRLLVKAPDVYYLLEQEIEPGVKYFEKMSPSEDGKPQEIEAILSGFLKHDTRGYYFDPLGKQLVELYKLGFSIQEINSLQSQYKKEEK